MARYTSNQLNRLADRLQDDGELTIQEVINLVGDCQHLTVDLINMTEERDAIAAELAKVKAGLPRWSNTDGERWIIAPSPKNGTPLGSVTRRSDYWMAVANGDVFMVVGERESAMLAVTEALGLPPCEVEGE